MKTTIKIVNVIVLILTIIVLILFLSSWFTTLADDIPEDFLFAISLIDLLLVIFLTTSILVSQQLLIKNSPELNELLRKDKLLKTKLTVLKKDKELLEIQNEIDKLKSISNSKDV